MAVTQADRAAAITPSDVTMFTEPTAIYVGTGGTLVVNMWGANEETTFTNVPNGSFLPILVDMVLSTGTTASDIVSLTKA